MGQLSAVSARRVRANRRNAKKSTGPRTPQGKARSSRNASTHGVFCRDLLLPGEDARLFQALRAGMLVRLNPQDVVELLLVDRAVGAMWRLLRLQGAESAAHEVKSEEMLDHYDRQLDKLARQIDQDRDNADSLQDEDQTECLAEHEEQVQQLRRQREQRPDSAPAEFTLLAMFQVPKGRRASTLENLSLYERRLEQTLHRSFAELRRLRTVAKNERNPTRLTPFLSVEEYEQAVHEPLAASVEPAEQDEAPSDAEPVEKDEQEPSDPSPPAVAARPSSEAAPPAQGTEVSGRQDVAAKNRGGKNEATCPAGAPRAAHGERSLAAQCDIDMISLCNQPEDP